MICTTLLQQTKTLFMLQSILNVNYKNKTVPLYISYRVVLLNNDNPQLAMSQKHNQCVVLEQLAIKSTLLVQIHQRRGHHLLTNTQKTGNTKENKMVILDKEGQSDKVHVHLCVHSQNGRGTSFGFNIPSRLDFFVFFW